MSIKASELPELIAAAVKKAVADHHITDEQLLSLAHRPITIGIIAQPELKAAESGVAEHAASPLSERVPFPHTMGFRLTSLDGLKDLKNLKGLDNE